MKAFSKRLAVVSCALRFLVFLPSLMGQAQNDAKEYVPSEMQVVDPEVQTYLDSEDAKGRSGEYDRAFLLLQKALELCSKKVSVYGGPY